LGSKEIPRLYITIVIIILREGGEKDRHGPGGSYSLFAFFEIRKIDEEWKGLDDKNRFVGCFFATKKRY
jgi:hypothetical protein